MSLVSVVFIKVKIGIYILQNFGKFYFKITLNKVISIDLY
jgi:hypothetical protein